MKKDFYLTENEADLIYRSAVERWAESSSWGETKKRSCMLCVAFLYSGEEGLCEECPVTRYTGAILCHNTPLWKIKETGEKGFKKTRIGMISLANEMLEAGGFGDKMIDMKEV